jgi:hypothetical protein
MGRSQDLSYFHKEFIMPGHYGKMMKNEEMKRKKKGAGGKMRYGMTAGGNALARRDNDKKRTGMMMGGGMKTSGSQPSYAHGANGGMGGPL